MTTTKPACPRCSSDLHEASDMYGQYRECWTCGYIKNIDTRDGSAGDRGLDYGGTDSGLKGRRLLITEVNTYDNRVAVIYHCPFDNEDYDGPCNLEMRQQGTRDDRGRRTRYRCPLRHIVTIRDEAFWF